MRVVEEMQEFNHFLKNVLELHCDELSFQAIL